MQPAKKHFILSKKMQCKQMRNTYTFTIIQKLYIIEPAHKHVSLKISCKH